MRLSAAVRNSPPVRAMRSRSCSTLSASTGYAIQVVFDAPFYKLRAGGWNNKKAADDKARELSAYNISAFVVKVR